MQIIVFNTANSKEAIYYKVSDQDAYDFTNFYFCNEDLISIKEGSIKVLGSIGAN